jgi:hypothetical protein
VSGDNQHLVVTPAGNSRLFTMLPNGNVEDVLDLGTGESFGHRSCAAWRCARRAAARR